MTNEFKIDTRDLERFAQKYAKASQPVQRLAQAFLYDVATGQSRAIASKAPGKQLPNVISPYAQGWQSGVKIAFPKKILEFIIGGTRRHVINGNSTLVFMWKGQQRFFHRVMHPGTKPNNFIEKGIRDYQPTFRKQVDALKQHIKRAVIST